MEKPPLCNLIFVHWIFKELEIILWSHVHMWYFKRKLMQIQEVKMIFWKRYSHSKTKWSKCPSFWTSFLILFRIERIVLKKLLHWHNKRRWYNGQHSCLPSSWSGFDSRPTQCFKFYFLKSWREKVLSMPWPGFEPGLLRPQRRVLTTRRSRLRTVVLVLRTFGLAYYQKC